MKEKSDVKGRRSFLNFIIGFGFLAFGIHLLRSFLLYFLPPKEITEEGKGGENMVIDLEEIPDGESKKVLFKNTPYIIVRKGREVYVLSAVCTHLGCLVNWEPDAGEIICPCHSARFSLNGNVLGGPAPSPLQKINVKIENGKIIIG